MGVVDGIVEFVSVGFGIPDEVHPVASPGFSETRRCEEPVDNGSPTGSGGIREKARDFLPRRREASQVEGDPSKPGSRVGGMGGAESVLG